VCWAQRREIAGQEKNCWSTGRTDSASSHRAQRGYLDAEEEGEEVVEVKEMKEGGGGGQKKGRRRRVDAWQLTDSHSPGGSVWVFDASSAVVLFVIAELRVVGDLQEAAFHHQSHSQPSDTDDRSRSLTSRRLPSLGLAPSSWETCHAAQEHGDIVRPRKTHRKIHHRRHRTARLACGLDCGPHLLTLLMLTLRCSSIAFSSRNILSVT
jgi:hypothetical protein